jgi:hypothetical protein
MRLDWDDALKLGVKIASVVDDLEDLDEPGDTADLPPIRMRLDGKRVKISIIVEVLD